MRGIQRQNFRGDSAREDYDKLIGEVDLVWMVYGRERVRTGPILAWPDAPVTRLFS